MKLEDAEMDPNIMGFLDKAHFQYNGYVNNQIIRHRGTESPHLSGPERVSTDPSLFKETLQGILVEICLKRVL